MSKFVKATKAQSFGRLALVGPSGAGKTYSALRIASAMGSRVAFIDTENGSASKYADKFSFDVLELTSFSPLKYVQALAAAQAEGYEVVIVDSLSHAWMGKDGALELADRAAKRSQSGNSFTAWRDVTPQHNALVEAMLRLRAHLIVCMRAKTEYVIEEDSRGKRVPRKIGLMPIQRHGMEYEFDVVGDINADHELIISKSRCPALADGAFKLPGEDVGAQFLAWLRDGTAMPPATTESTLLAAVAMATTVEQLRTVWAQMKEADIGQDARLRVTTAMDARRREIDPVFAARSQTDRLRQKLTGAPAVDDEEAAAIRAAEKESNG